MTSKIGLVYSQTRVTVAFNLYSACNKVSIGHWPLHFSVITNTWPYKNLRLGSNIGAYASGSKHLATVKVIGLFSKKASDEH